MADELLEISEADADRYFLTQVLTGDTADGYKGVPGIGPKKAEAILGPRPDWAAVEKAYIDAGLTRTTPSTGASRQDIALVRLARRRPEAMDTMRTRSLDEGESC